MKHYQLTIISKNKKSAENCFLFFLNNTSELNLNIIKKYFQKKRKKNVLTILKSPHVNKAAQEQFESKLFSKQLSIYSSKNFQFLLFLKKIKTRLFPDVKIKIKFILNKNLSEKTKINILNPSNFKLNVLKNIKLEKYVQSNKKRTKNKHYELNKKSNLENIQNLLKIFDMYSELQKINSLDSSVGRAKD
jgi:ribosomal protein S10